MPTFQEIYKLLQTNHEAHYVMTKSRDNATYQDAQRTEVLAFLKKYLLGYEKNSQFTENRFHELLCIYSQYSIEHNSPQLVSIFLNTINSILPVSSEAVKNFQEYLVEKWVRG